MPKKHQGAILVDDMELTLAIGLIKRRSHTIRCQLPKPWQKILIELIHIIRVDGKGHLCPQRLAIGLGRAFQ